MSFNWHIQLTEEFLKKYPNYTLENGIHDIDISLISKTEEQDDSMIIVACLVAVRFEEGQHRKFKKRVQNILLSTDDSQMSKTVHGNLNLLESVVGRIVPRKTCD